MKKLVSLSLGFLILLNTFGFNIIFIYLLQEYRSETFEVIEEHPESIAPEKIVVFSLKKDNLKLLNHREIICNNEMYDIINKENSGSDIIFYCIKDDHDTKLHTAFCSLNDINSNPASLPDHIAGSVLKNLLKNYLANPSIQLIEIHKSLRFCLINNSSFQSIILKKILPPPKPQIIS